MKRLLNKLNFIIIICVMTINIGCSKQNDLENNSNTIDTSNYSPTETEGISETSNNNYHTESLEIKRTFEEAIGISNCIVNAKYIELHIKGKYVEYEFKVNEILFGDIPEESFYLTAYEEDNIGDKIYKKDEDYMLVMEKQESLFFDNDARYLLLSNIFIPMNETYEKTMYGKSIKDNAQDSFTDYKDIGEYIKNIKNVVKESESISQFNDMLAFTKSDNMMLIVEESNMILELSIEDVIVEDLSHNGIHYICTIDNILKGDIEENIGDQIKVLLLKDSVQIGSKYIIMLNTLGQDSFLQSSKNGIVSVEDDNLVDEINAYIN